MSMMQELISSIVDAERRIDDQVVKLHSYLRELDIAAQKTDAAFAGSGVRCGQEMIDQIERTKNQVNETIIRLNAAKEKLTRVKVL